jgi:hypothetical protein
MLQKIAPNPAEAIAATSSTPPCGLRRNRWFVVRKTLIE